MSDKNKKPLVLGRYVYIDVPEKPETKIEVDENTKQALMKEWISKLSRLQIWAVGTATSDNIKEGDWVLVDPERIGSIKMVPFDGHTKALIMEDYIVHIWP